MKDGSTRQLTSLYVADGPPKSYLTVQYWNASAGAVSAFDILLFQAVNITKIRCIVDKERGNRYESIGTDSRVTACKDATLEQWWFTPTATTSNTNATKTEV